MFLKGNVGNSPHSLFRFLIVGLRVVNAVKWASGVRPKNIGDLSSETTQAINIFLLKCNYSVYIQTYIPFCIFSLKRFHSLTFIYFLSLK